MPRYDYRCQACSHLFELKQSFQDPPVAACPQCGSDSQRVLSAPEIVYKAAGFHTSDQRRTGFGNYWYNREAQADAAGRNPDISASEPSSESK